MTGFHRDDLHRDDLHRDDLHRDDLHRDDLHSDDLHRDDLHRDDLHSDRYLKPGRTTTVFNSAVAWLTRAGVSILGSRELGVRGRRSGEWRTTPVNLLVVDGRRYLVAPRGQTQWVRNIRVAGAAELRLGRRIEPFRAVELANEDKPAILRRYLKRWKFEVGVFFDGVDAKSSDARLLEIAPGYPVFCVEPAPASS